MPEQWRAIPLPGLTRYAVSDRGRVRNSRTKHLMRIATHSTQDYLQVGLHDRWSTQVLRVARLVWLAFTGEDNHGMGFDYKDGNYRNCALENLIPRARKVPVGGWKYAARGAV